MIAIWFAIPTTIKGNFKYPNYNGFGGCKIMTMKQLKTLKLTIHAHDKCNEKHKYEKLQVNHLKSQ